MVYLIIGKQNSGKSKYYENMLQASPVKIYFGTLWHCDDTFHIIENHQNRRGNDWILVESIGNVNEDRRILVESVKSVSKPCSCMIDGIVNWCIHCSQTANDYKAISQQLAKMITDVVNEYSDISWYLLDNEKDDYYRTPALQDMWKAIHHYISESIYNLQIIQWEG